jgi:hypothetical protein
MKASRVYLFLLLAITAARAAVAADDPIAVVRALRTESNAAIAAHDPVRLAKIFDDDYSGIEESELFVTLSCTGSVSCQGAD